MMTYYMGSNLRSLLSSDKVPSMLATLLPFIKSAIDPDTHRSLMSDLAVFRAQVEPVVAFNEKQQMLLSTDAYTALLARMTSDSGLHNGISFAAHNSGLLCCKQFILSPLLKYWHQSQAVVFASLHSQDMLAIARCFIDQATYKADLQWGELLRYLYTDELLQLILIVIKCSHW